MFFSSSMGPSAPVNTPREQLAEFVEEADAFFAKPFEPFNLLWHKDKEIWVAAGQLAAPKHPCFDCAEASIVRTTVKDMPSRYQLTLRQLASPENHFDILQDTGGRVVSATGDTLNQIGNFNLVRDVVGSLVTNRESTLALAELYQEPLLDDDIMRRLFTEYPDLARPK